MTAEARSRLFALLGAVGGACMRLASIVAASCICFGTQAVYAAPNAAEAPCSGAARGCSSDDAQRLNSAFLSDLTTDEQRAKMKSIIAAKTASGVTDWMAAAGEYFAWRAGTMGYAQPPAVAPERPGYKEQQEEARKQALERQRAFRAAAEAAVRAKLFDPESARFEWPYGFAQGSWKPLLERHIYGWLTCGWVNGRNRFGGYVGSSAFVVVLDDATAPLFVDIDDGDHGLIQAQCDRMVSSLPSAPPEQGGAQSSTAGPLSVADELEKLAALRDKGILTQSEFEAQKAKLLGEH